MKYSIDNIASLITEDPDIPSTKRQITEALDLPHVPISYRVYEWQNNQEAWFKDYSEVLEFFGSFNPDLNDQQSGSITPYYKGKPSSVLGQDPAGFHKNPDATDQQLRWTTEGQPLGNIHWFADGTDMIVEVWVEADHSGDELPQDPLIGFIEKHGGKFKVDMTGDWGAMWDETSPGHLGADISFKYDMQ